MNNLDKYNLSKTSISEKMFTDKQAKIALNVEIIRKDFVNVLKQYEEHLYIENIVEFFDKYGEKAIESNFSREAYKLYLMIKENKSVNEINDFVKVVKKTPLTYGEMRSFFG